MSLKLKKTMKSAAKRAFDIAEDILEEMVYSEPGEVYDPATRTVSGCDIEKSPVRAMPSSVHKNETTDKIRLTDKAVIFLQDELDFGIDLEGYFTNSAGIKFEILKKQVDPASATLRVIMRAAADG